MIGKIKAFVNANGICSLLVFWLCAFAFMLVMHFLGMGRSSSIAAGVCCLAASWKTIRELNLSLPGKICWLISCMAWIQMIIEPIR